MAIVLDDPNQHPHQHQRHEQKMDEKAASLRQPLLHWLMTHLFCCLVGPKKKEKKKKRAVFHQFK
ncbi:hypothetical protein BDF20DRAFT_868862 [Mycotypha africana]|uniref:uncharacterized protein n=1 Tax=Mycotypha africana TaxID=64632 RepID=UPI002300272D|nr:uncharacterized protein BDF20DRAFT_868862 [Mycotypha africana]KAI8979317.1 hypothetical protein BDF20DRAFT_868862 [Mycotypha africana]